MVHANVRSDFFLSRLETSLVVLHILSSISIMPAVTSRLDTLLLRLLLSLDFFLRRLQWTDTEDRLESLSLESLSLESLSLESLSLESSLLEFSPELSLLGLSSEQLELLGSRSRRRFFLSARFFLAWSFWLYLAYLSN